MKPTELSPTERREYVALAVTTGKSNRSIAIALAVDEATVRRDRKFLTKTVDECQPRSPLPKRKNQTRGRTFTAGELRERRRKELLNVAQSWIAEQTSVLADVHYILDNAGKLLYRHRLSLRSIAPSAQSPVELLVRARPRTVEADDVTGLEFLSAWFARWLALCLPADEELQNDVLRTISIWAQSPPRRFVY